MPPAPVMEHQARSLYYLGSASSLFNCLKTTIFNSLGPSNSNIQYKYTKGENYIFTCHHRCICIWRYIFHYNDVTMGAIAFQMTSLTIVYSIVYSDADQRKHHSSVSLAEVRGINRGPVNSPHKWPVTRKMFPFDDVMFYQFTKQVTYNRTILIGPCIIHVIC